MRSIRSCLCVLGAILAGTAVLQAAETDGKTSIRCEGEYPWHLQGTATDGTYLYWSFSDRVVKTDGTGRLVKSSAADKLHYGDLCVVDGTVYVAFNGGAFNEETGADSRVYALRADDLTKVGEWKVPQVVHGAGGIAYRDGLFYVVGGLPKTHVKNYLYVYRPDFTFVKRIDVESGYTMLGVQAIDFIRGDCLLGVYPLENSSVGLVRCPLDCSFCEMLSLAGYCGMVDYQGCFYQGQAISVDGDESRQAGQLNPTVLPKISHPPRKGNCVAWYRFEEGKAGCRTTAATILSNTADPTKHAARPYVHVPTASGANLATEPAALMPEHVDSFSRAYRILDPVTGKTYANARALRFDVADNETQTGSPGGTVLVEDDAAFHLQSMTVECFVRIPSVADTRERLLFGQRSRNNSLFTWGVKYVSNAARVEISIPKPAGGETRLCACGKNDLEDGKWHHLAFTVDAEDGEVRFYEDYRCTQTVSFEGAICYDDALPIMFGPCRKLSYSPLCHDLDEVRITDCALIPDHFLHAVPMAAPSAKATDDTLVLLDFEGRREEATLTDFVTPAVWREAFRNKVPRRDLWAEVCAEPYVKEGSSRVAPVQLVDGPSGTACHTVTNAADNDWAEPLVLKGRCTWQSLFEDDMTFEAEFKLPEKGNLSSENRELHLFAQWAGLQVTTGWANDPPGMNGNGYVGCWVGTSRLGRAGGNFFGQKYVRDGKWHHVAVVYRKAAARAELYVDRSLELSADNVGFPSEALPGSYVGELVLGGPYYNTWHALDVKYDNIRITRGALAPSGFLIEASAEPGRRGMALTVVKSAEK